MSAEFDLAVVGGGVNGCGIARDAAGRGLSVLLVEAGDLAGATSSASSKLVHGGLRYLEHFEFRLVRESLAERSRLLACAPHLVEPLRFVIPQAPSIRGAVRMRIGLFLYDRLAGAKTLADPRLMRSRAVSLEEHAYGAPLAREFTRGFVYSDCRVDDSRMVVLAAMDARERGADIRTRTKLIGAERADGLWNVQIESCGKIESLRCRALINACGPWAADVAKLALGHASAERLRLVKGSQLITRRLYEGDHAYVLQNPDGRIVFSIPFEDAFTLIGATEIAFEGDPRRASIDPAEREYLYESVNRYFDRKLTADDVIATFSGVRPLHDDGAQIASAVTRDYVFALDQEHGAPLLSVYGGKLTSFRALAERACDALARFFPAMGAPWTGSAVLPGGDLPAGGRTELAGDLLRERSFLSAPLARRLVRAYGMRALRLLGAASSMADLGRDFGCGLTEAEVDYLRTQEWARSVEDLLWRRTKLALRLDAREQQELSRYLNETPSSVVHEG